MSLSSFSRWLFVIVACLPLVVTCEAQAQAPDAKSSNLLNASHILIAHAEVKDGDAKRTKAEALAIAKKVAATAKSPGVDFAALAQKHSDGPTGERGGDLGNFAPGRMIPAFSAATMKLKVGEVSEPVESEFGYHVILRKAIADDVCAANILIMHTELERVPPTVKRTKAEALALAQKLAKQLQARSDNFSEVAMENSDGPNAAGGGHLGTFQPSVMLYSISKATVALKIGEVSDPVESEFGYHIVLRRPMPRKTGARHVLVQWKGSAKAPPTVTRTKEEALVRLKECIGKLKTTEFADLAKEYSDGPSGPNGGDLREVIEWQMAPSFNKALFSMEMNTVSDIVETAFGYHVIQRRPLPQTTGAKHILIKWKGLASADETTTRTREEALARINQCIAKLKTSKFEDLAVEYSEGPTGPSGGDLGRVTEGDMVPPFDAALFKMKVGTVSDVVETQFGYHIIYRY